MPVKGIRVLGFELSIAVNKDTVAVRGAVRNRLWRLIYGLLSRVIVRKKRADTAPSVEREPAAVAGQSPEQRALLERVSQTGWYHTIDLGHAVVTPGQFDHRPYLAAYQMPERVDGLRVLDVATFDGFWAFEFEKRGAKEVVAIDVERFGDIDIPTVKKAGLTDEQLNQKLGRGFEIAKGALASRVRREILSVYDLSAEAFGKFDVVHIGDVLVHLENPLKALRNVCSVTGGYAMISDCYRPDLAHLGVDRLVQYHGGMGESGVWWWCSLDALERMIRDAGFGKVELLNTFAYGPRNAEGSLHHAVFRAYP